MAGAVTAQINNSLVSTFNLHKPEYSNFLFRKYGKQGFTAFQFLQSLGNVTPVAQENFYHFEENWIASSFTTTGGSGAAGASVNLTVSPAYIDASGNYYPRLNDILMFADGVKAQVIADNGSGVLTVRPLKAAQAITVAADEQIIIPSNSFGEGTGQPDGRVSDVFRYEFNMQIIKETINTTGTELTNQMWVNSIDGTTINAWFDKAKSIDLDYRMALAIDGMLLYGTKADNTGILGSTSEGLVDAVTTQGGNGTYTSGLFSIAQFDQMNRYLDKQQAPNEYTGLLGYQAFQDVENALSNVFTQNPIIFAGGNGKTLGQMMYGDMASKIGESVDIGFRSITKTDRTFHLLKLAQLSNPQLYGATGFNEASRMIFVPLDKPVAPKGGQVPRLGIRYKELGGYSRKMEAWYTGSAGNFGFKTNDIDSVQLHNRAHMGAVQYGVNQFFQFTT
jgi:hypothetical protein